MHNVRLKIIAALCGPLLAGGCAFFKPSPASVALAPLGSLTSGSGANDADYRKGRAFQERYDMQKAIDSYRKALRENPQNAEAHNALGVIYAMQGRNDQAITELIAAASLAPTAGHIQNNLGFAYLLGGRTADAMATLQIAAGLDPANQRIRDNLKSAQARMNAIRPPVDPVAEAIAKVQPAVQPPPETTADPNAPTLVSVAPNVYELKQHLPRIAQQPLPAPSPAAAAPINIKVEVANGNGVTGMAKRTSTYLKERGYVIARLTNQVPYTQASTEIQYRRGRESEARRLTHLIAVPATVVESSELDSAVGMRIVLGRDVAARELFADNGARRLGKTNDALAQAPGE